MICPQCGTENAPGDKFCEQCGTPLSTASSGVVDEAAATMVGGPPQSAVLIRSDDPNQTFPLGNRALVGRLDTCDIPIHDKSVSREHARLSQLPGGYVVEDLGSTNGTLVNGEPIREAVILRPGDTITFGSIDFQFQQEGAAADAASTQPFQYRPPAAPETPFAAPEPVSPTPAPFTPYEAPPAQPAFESSAGEQGMESEGGVPAFEFPPLQPLPAVDEPVAANSQPAAQQDVESAAPAESIPSFGAATPIAPPEAPFKNQASDETEPAVDVPPISPIPPSPSIAATSQPAGAGRAESVTMSDTLPDDVVAAAAHLSNLVQGLAQRAGQSDARLAESEARIRTLEERASRADELHGVLQDIPQPSANGSQLDSMRRLLDQLAEDPRDIELLMQVGRQAPDLSALLAEYVQMRQTLQRIAGGGTQS